MHAVAFPIEHFPHALFINNSSKQLQTCFHVISPAHCLIEFNQKLKVTNLFVFGFASSSTVLAGNRVRNQVRWLLFCVLIDELKKFVSGIAIGK
jgi:hypothetical protein